jgi:hypothetical protein
MMSTTVLPSAPTFKPGFSSADETAQRCRDNGIGHSDDAGMQSSRVESTEPPGLRAEPSRQIEDGWKSTHAASAAGALMADKDSNAGCA